MKDGWGRWGGRCGSGSGVAECRGRGRRYVVGGVDERGGGAVVGRGGGEVVGIVVAMGELKGDPPLSCNTSC